MNSSSPEPDSQVDDPNRDRSHRDIITGLRLILLPTTLPAFFCALFAGIALPHGEKIFIEMLGSADKLPRITKWGLQNHEGLQLLVLALGAGAAFGSLIIRRILPAAITAATCGILLWLMAPLSLSCLTLPLLEIIKQLS